MEERNDERAREAAVALAYQSRERAERYGGKHRLSAGTRLRDVWERLACRRALAVVGPVESALDCPAGTGRFWRLLARRARRLLVADAAADMIQVGIELHPEIDLAGVEVGFLRELRLPAASVELAFCSRLLHHYPSAAERVAILRRLGELTSRWVVVSLWLTGNWKHRRSVRRVAPRRQGRPPGRYFVSAAELRRDCGDAGLAIVALRYKLRGISPLVFVVLEKRP